MHRPPIVTILGHVDHGKTTLLDYIRKTDLTVKEHGGITQKIGAYEITTDIKGYNTNKITFIDTPGHEAFSLLRARGANVADIAILLIDGKDSVMPQTEESISHIKSAKIPFIVAVNKIDLPDTNPEKVKNDLLKYSVQVEEKGGNVPVVPVSAKSGKGINELLEAILLIATDLNLNYSPESPFKAYILETKKDRRGVIVSAVIKDGTIKIADVVKTGNYKVKVRAMFDDKGKNVAAVSPSKPFEMLGFTDLPEVGSVLLPPSATDETVKKSAKTQVVRQMIDLETLLNPTKKEKKLSVVVKVDSQGSLEAIEHSLGENKDVDIVLKAVGDVNKSDIFLAKSTNSIIIGFAIGVSDEAKQLAKQEKVIIKSYNIIYELLDELEEVADLIKEKQQKERNLKGEGKILANFLIKGEKIFGIKVLKGKLNLGDELEIFRSDKPFAKTKLVSLKIRAKPVNEVKKDQEAGIILSHQLDIHIGDVVKSIL